MNNSRARTSVRIHWARRKTRFDEGANPRRNKNKTENAMLRKISAALLATALIAGPAFAAQPSGSAGSTPAAATTPAPASTDAVTKAAAKPIKATKTVKHVVR